MTSPFWMLLLLLPALPLATPTQATPPGSGRLTTRGGHRCSWESSGEGEEGEVTLLLRCTSGSPPHLHRFWCRYAGLPARCPYHHHPPGSRPPRSRPGSRPYWKQILAGLRRKPHPCQGDQTLQTLQTLQTCRTPTEAQLVEQGVDQENHRDQGRAERGGAKGRGPSEVGSSEMKQNEEVERRGEEERRGEVSEEEERRRAAPINTSGGSYAGAEGAHAPTLRSRYRPIFLLQSFGTSAMLGPVVMPMDMAVRFYIAHSPPPLRGLLASSYEDLQRGRRSLASGAQRGSSQASPQGRNRPLRPCISSSQRALDSRKKRVVFADSRGLSLTAVHVFSDREQPRAGPSSEDLLFQMTDLETVAMEMKVQTSLRLDFQQPSGDYLDFRARLLRNGVCLESCSLQRRSLTGTAKVRNLGFSKSVSVRITFDSWASHSDAACTFMNNVYGCQDTDTFAFSLELPARVSPQHRVEFCVCFRVAGQEFWDNNDGRNYVLRQAGWKEELPTPPAPPPTSPAPPRAAADLRKPGDSGTHVAMRLLDAELDQFGSPRTSSGLFPGWQSWGPAEVSTAYW
ncbi:unnamed protein product [Merluccius merluccius]